MGSTKRILISLVSLLLGAAAARPAAAAGSSLDASFGNGGTVVLAGVHASQATMSLAVQTNGDILVATQQPSQLLRVLPDGSLDASFGTGGVVPLTVIPLSLALQGDGRILIAGVTSSSGSVVARFNAAGTPDATFGQAGQVSTSVGATVALQLANGQILIGGGVSGPPVVNRRITTYTALARLNADGSADAAFGQGGSVVVNSIGFVYALGIESDGSILALDPARLGLSSFVARFTAGGAPEAVGVSGTVSPVLVSNQTPGPQATFLPDGHVLFAGAAKGPNRTTDFGKIVRYTAQGTLDTTFNSPVFDWGGGINTSDVPAAVAVGPNGMIASCGEAEFGTPLSAFGVGAFLPTGSLDTSFGQGGLTSTSITGFDEPGAIVFQPDGKFIVGGFGQASGGSVVLARY